MKKFAFVFCLFSVLAGFDARAADQTDLGVFGIWSAYMFEENGGKVCYMSAKPDKSTGKYSKRGEVAVMITHRTAESTKDVFSFMSGYGYKNASQVDVMIDGKSFMLFTQNDMAWAADAAADAALVKALKKGAKMTINGVSARGTQTKDEFSLNGATKSYEAISKACQI